MNSMYESDKLLAEYLLFHYGSAQEVLPSGRVWPAGMAASLDFPVRTAARFRAGEAERGLDLGCAVGRSTFELSRHCREVLGVDFSQQFIAAADRIRLGGVVAYDRVDEATLAVRLEARLPDGVHPDRVRFLQGDAMDLPSEIGLFDRVHAANLLCRLAQPQLLLARLPGLVRPGGELVLATPCTWLESFTPPQHWPGGSTLDWLIGSLGGHFSLEETLDEPFLIRETARKFQWAVSMLTRWVRR